MEERSFADDKLVLVTGATDGIGKETARALLRSGARVLLHGRTAEKAARVADELRRDTKRGATAVLIADFTSLAAVRRLASEVRERHARLRIVVNNAGVYSPEQRLTEDGFEQTLQVQYLAPFLLTTELLPRLREHEPARVINVTSRLHRDGDLDLLLRGPSPYDGHKAYASSKLLLMLFTRELAERLRGTEVAVNAVHPGGVDTKLLRAGYGGRGVPVAEGARPVVHLATAVRTGTLSNRYFERFKETDPDPRTYNDEVRARLWERTERALRLARAA